MKRILRLAQHLFAVALFAVPLTANASTTIIKVPLGETNTSDDVYFDGTTFGTLSDGDALTLGDQDTSVNFVGIFSGLFADLVSPPGSFTLSGVTATGSTGFVNTVFSQQTTGGSFSLYDPSNVLLLSGDLADGAITGSLNSQTGSFFDTTVGTFTGGTLLPYLLPQSFGLSIALNGVQSGNLPGFTVDQNGNLSAFTAAGSGLIQGAAVPEPVTAIMLLTGASAAVLRRRKQRAVEL